MNEKDTETEFKRDTN